LRRPRPPLRSHWGLCREGPCGHSPRGPVQPQRRWRGPPNVTVPHDARPPRVQNLRSAPPSALFDMAHQAWNLSSPSGPVPHGAHGPLSQHAAAPDCLALTSLAAAAERRSPRPWLGNLASSPRPLRRQRSCDNVGDPLEPQNRGTSLSSPSHQGRIQLNSYSRRCSASQATSVVSYRAKARFC
jgi:hypothetical protein